MKKVIQFFSILIILSSCSEEITVHPHKFVKIPAGTFFFGSDSGSENEGPAYSCMVNEFQLATKEVSNEQFEVFVKETNYKTDAEEYGGFVFDGSWKLDSRANWRNPEGKKVDREKWKSLPVVQLSYSDAIAYSDWADCRLPTEIEWEYAAKLGKSDLMEANITHPERTHTTIAEVKSFGKNELDFYHQLGNVWELCADVYNSEIHEKLPLFGTISPFDAFNGRSFDPEKMDAFDTLRVIKGGSFLCQVGHCEGYRPEARQSVEQHQGYFHIGFRVAKDVK